MSSVPAPSDWMFRSPAAAAGTTLVTRNVTMAGRRTSMRLEPAMWAALDEIAWREGKRIGEIAGEVAASGATSSLTAGIRIFVVGYFRAAATEEGHRLAGHGCPLRRADVSVTPPLSA